MSNGQELFASVNDPVSVSIRLACPEDILRWSSGPVTNADFDKEPLDQPHPAGLFSERLFGPLVDWRCGCHIAEGRRFWPRDRQGTPCPVCGVLIDRALVRRRRMGHIVLAVPVVHTWFLHGRPSPLALLLDMRATDLAEVIYYQHYLLFDPGNTKKKAFSLLDALEVGQLREQGKQFSVDIGAPAIRSLLQKLDLDKREKEVRGELDRLRTLGKREARQKVLQNTLRVLAWLRDSGNRPEWMVLTHVPVLPPDLRPMRELPGGTRYCSDLNLFYQGILRKNASVGSLLEKQAPSVIRHREAKFLQQAVDALFDNARCETPLTGTTKKPLRSLTDFLGGKTGRFRRNLLGKRVDFSGRAVIVAGPTLRLHQCGLPRFIAEELYRPMLLGRLARLLYSALTLPWPLAIRTAEFVSKGQYGWAIRALRKAISEYDVWQAMRLIRAYPVLHDDWLREAMQQSLVLLNRAPSLHRMNIQAFEPILSEGNAIYLHPLLCEGFGADFDGDTMAVHLPLTAPALEEAATRLRPVHNLLSPAHGRPTVVPSHEMILGCFYLTARRGDRETRRQGDKELRVFASFEEVHLAHTLGKIKYHDSILIRLPANRVVVNEEGLPVSLSQRIETTVGRVLFNETLPNEVPFYNLAITRKVMSGIIADCFRICGRSVTAQVVDRLMDLGFQMATRSGLSFIVEDLIEPSNKREELETARVEVEELRRQCAEGKITDDERYNATVERWTRAQEAIERRLIEEMEKDHRVEANGNKEPYLNPLYLMAHSGARTKWEQIRQLCAMRGLMAKTSGLRRVVEMPIESNLREGLRMHEYWLSTHGARKAGADKAAVPDAGDLTRRLVDVAHHVVITTHDCGTTEGRRASLDSARGRILIGSKELITHEVYHRLKDTKTREVTIRGPMTCAAPRGLCQLCYGVDLSTQALVELGTAVGVLAAQSIGEPGTQLAMKTKHTGGIAQTSMVNALDRVTALFETRVPRQPALLSEGEGQVELRSRPEGVFILVRPSPKAAPWVHGPVTPRRVKVAEGATVTKGEVLSAGAPRYDDLLRLRGIEAVRQYLFHELRTIYRENGVHIDDRHFEVILARIVARWRIDDAGDTRLLSGAMVGWKELLEANRAVEKCVRITEAGTTSLTLNTLLDEQEYLLHREAALAAHRVPPLAVSAAPACATPLGITLASLEVESFLSAASFQHPRKVLMEAALAGKVDPLHGLKENILLGRLIPVGTGFRPDANLSSHDP